ncbi:hypothetical protein M8J76_007161 [Diaphorina citri]|nr:hypothetical protein M8J76_007161 [Diaphorina citri]
MTSLDGHKITMSQLSATSIQHENTTTTSVPKSEEDDVEDIEFPKNVLSELFDDAFIKIIDLVDCDEEVILCSTTYQNLVRKNITILKDLTHRVTELGLFHDLKTRSLTEASLQSQLFSLSEATEKKHEDTSLPEANDGKLDHQVEEMKYLLIPALLGLLYLKIKDNDRQKILDLACVYFIDFISRCKKFNLVEHPCKILPNNVFQVTDFSFINEYKDLKETRKNKIRELSSVLHKMKQNHNIENCHDLTANEQYLYSSEDDDISSSDDMDQSCLPEKFRIEIPEPSTAVDFESFVLYKYGRDYLKAKRLVEDRDEEKQYSDGISNLQESLDSPNKNVSSDNTLPEITKKPEVQSTDEFDRNDFAFSVESFIHNQIRKELKAHWKEESSENGPPGEGSLRVYDKESGKYGDFSLPANDNLVSGIPPYSHIIELYVLKCLQEIENCILESKIQESLREAAYFQPSFLEEIKHVANLEQDEAFFVPVLIE